MPIGRRQISLDERLSRVGGGITSAAVFLSAARSPRFVPQYEEKLNNGQVQTGANYMQVGLHMMGIVSLCAVLEQSRRRDLVNLPSLLRRLEDAAERRRLAIRLEIDPAVLYRRIARIKERFESHIVPRVDEVKSMRDEALARDREIIDWALSTGAGRRIVQACRQALADGDGHITGMLAAIAAAEAVGQDRDGLVPAVEFVIRWVQTNHAAWFYRYQEHRPAEVPAPTRVAGTVRPEPPEAAAPRWRPTF